MVLGEICQPHQHDNKQLLHQPHNVSLMSIKGSDSIKNVKLVYKSVQIQAHSK